MRHVRMLGLCLVAAFAVSAMAAVPAMAKKATTGFQKLEHCPYTDSEIAICTADISGPGSEFKAGNIKVQLETPIVLQGGLRTVEEGPHAGESQFLAPVGVEALAPVKQKAPSLEEVVNPAELSAKELKRYERDVAAGRTKGFVAIELAGSVEQVYLDTSNLLEENGPTLTLPVKVRLINPFVGNDCYVGSDADPIEITLTTGQSGALRGNAGTITTIEEGDILLVEENSLVNGTYSSPGVEGCGVADGADAAIDSKIGLPAGEGQNTTTIKGSIFLAGAEEVAEHFGA